MFLSRIQSQFHFFYSETKLFRAVLTFANLCWICLFSCKPGLVLKLSSFPGCVWSFYASLHFCEGCWVLIASLSFWKYFYMAFGSSSSLSIHPWPSNSYCALSSLSRGLHSTLGSCCFLYPCISRICDVSLRTTSSHLFVGFQLVLCYEISH